MQPDREPLTKGLNYDMTPGFDRVSIYLLLTFGGLAALSILLL